MSERWRKLGLVFASPDDQPWRLTHAATPTAEVLDESWVRVYFTSRDARNRSHISCVELNLRDPRKTRALSAAPLVAPGPTGSFDDCGCAVACLVRDGNRRLLYYLGWHLTSDVPWRNTIGLAIAEGDSLKFEKSRTQPLMGLDPIDPHSISYPWVLRDGPRWRMWYGSNLAWGKTEETMQHVIKTATSSDGVAWRRTGKVAIPLAGDGKEFAVARPCVARDEDRLRMWYARRTPAYRIGYAESLDGERWERRDRDVGIEPSGSGFDSESVEYACVFDADGDRWMLYNGNRYGREGFGLAVLER